MDLVCYKLSSIAELEKFYLIHLYINSIHGFDSLLIDLTIIFP